MSKLGDFLSKVGFHIETQRSQIDLVCGMDVSEKTKHRVNYKGKLYFFCSDGCKSHFEIDPEKYLA